MKTLRQAVEDPGVPPNSLSILAYMTEHPKTTMHKVLKRFNKKRSWWTRNLQPLKDGNYITHLKLKGGPNEHWIHEYFVAEKESVTPEVLPVSSAPYTRHMKWIDPLTTKPETYDLAGFYLDLGFPVPNKPEEIQQAKQPGMKTWATVTKNYVGWGNAEEINAKLGNSPNQKALAIAWKEWKFSGYRQSNARGILDWYSILDKDITAEPWNSKQRSNSNGSARRNNQKVRKEQEKPSSEYNPDDYTSIALDSNSS